MAAQFEDLPLIVSIVGAAVVLVLFELVLPVVMANMGQNSSTHFNYASLFTPLVRLLGAFLAVAILLFGLKGAIRRFIDGMLAARRSRKVFERAIARPGALSVTWSQLEDLVGQAYLRLGYEVVRRGGARPDGGVDLELHRAGERILVQCKHWKSWQVGVKPIRELWGVAASEGATRAIFVTSGTYTQAALSFAADKALELLDGRALAGIIEAAGRGPSSQPLAPVAHPQAAVMCPRCGRTMIRRVARHGPNSGQAFWGCSDYPTCKGTLPITA